MWRANTSRNRTTIGQLIATSGIFDLITLDTLCWWLMMNFFHTNVSDEFLHCCKLKQTCMSEMNIDGSNVSKNGQCIMWQTNVTLNQQKTDENSTRKCVAKPVFLHFVFPLFFNQFRMLQNWSFVGFFSIQSKSILLVLLSFPLRPNLEGTTNIEAKAFEVQHIFEWRRNCWCTMSFANLLLLLINSTNNACWFKQMLPHMDWMQQQEVWMSNVIKLEKELQQQRITEKRGVALQMTEHVNLVTIWFNTCKCDAAQQCHFCKRWTVSFCGGQHLELGQSCQKPPFSCSFKFYNRGFSRSQWDSPVQVKLTCFSENTNRETWKLKSC